MNAGIGAPGGNTANAFGTKGKDGILDGLLDRRTILLALPADIAGAVIFDQQAKARHASTVPAARRKPRRNASAGIAALPGR